MIRKHDFTRIEAYGGIVIVLYRTPHLRRKVRFINIANLSLDELSIIFQEENGYSKSWWVAGDWYAHQALGEYLGKHHNYQPSTGGLIEVCDLGI